VGETQYISRKRFSKVPNDWVVRRGELGQARGEGLHSSTVTDESVFELAIIKALVLLKNMLIR